jgi:hypothetical protein
VPGNGQYLLKAFIMWDKSTGDSRSHFLFAILGLAFVILGGCQKKEATDVEDAYKIVPHLDKLSQIKQKEKMAEAEVDQIMVGFPVSIEEIKGDYAVAAATFKGKSAFVKVYDCKLPNSKRHFHIHVYFDEDHQVVGTSCSGKE